MPAYGYLRKSFVRDPDHDHSHEVQEEAVRELAARHKDNHGKLVMLEDWDVSGWKSGPDKRPGYAQLWQAIEDGSCTAIYSYSLSRLARSVKELIRLVEECNRRKIPIRLYADHVDTSTASGELLFLVLSSVAQFEARVASERVRAGIDRRVANGGQAGTVQFYGDGEDEDAAAVLAAYREAKSFSGAAKLLNERGIAPRNSKRGWWPSSVAVVVRRLDPSIGRRRAERGVPSGGTDFILARMLRCPTCATFLTGTRDRGGRRVRYSCRLGTALPHPRISISEHLILPAIRAEVERHLQLPGDRAETAERDQARLADLEARKARIIDLFEVGLIDRADRERRLATVHEAMEQIEAKRTIVVFPIVEATWELPPRELNQILKSVFKSITLDPESFQPIAFEPAVPEWWSA